MNAQESHDRKIDAMDREWKDFEDTLKAHRRKAMKPKLNARQIYALKADAVYTLRGLGFKVVEIAAVLGCTKERVRQLEARGRKQFSR